MLSSGDEEGNGAHVHESAYYWIIGPLALREGVQWHVRLAAACGWPTTTLRFDGSGHVPWLFNLLDPRGTKSCSLPLSVDLSISAVSDALESRHLLHSIARNWSGCLVAKRWPSTPYGRGRQAFPATVLGIPSESLERGVPCACLWLSARIVWEAAALRRGILTSHNKSTTMSSWVRG